MISGLAFMGHQIGSFVGAFGGGVIFDSLGSYNLAWQLAVMLGLLGGAVQIAFALYRPPRPPLALGAA
jgi:predicted MFS family arabinose efflux permease